MMGSRSTLTPLKDFSACVVLREWSNEGNPILENTSHRPIGHGYG